MALITSRGVLISLKRFEELISNEEKLKALEAAGVDNWDGYDYAIESIQENKQNEEF